MKKSLKRTKPPQEKPEQIYSLWQLNRMMHDKWKLFCQTYIRNGWNKVRAYMHAYPGTSYESAAVSANNLLKKPKIQQYIEYIKGDYELLCGVSKAKQIAEYSKIAYSSIAHMHNTWVKRKKFDKLTEEQKAAIESIEYKTEQRVINKELVDVVYVKVKLHPKIQALSRIDKLMDYESPKKVELSGEVSMQQVDLSKFTPEQKKVLLEMARQNAINQ